MRRAAALFVVVGALGLLAWGLTTGSAPRTAPSPSTIPQQPASTTAQPVASQAPASTVASTSPPSTVTRTDTDPKPTAPITTTDDTRAGGVPPTDTARPVRLARANPRPKTIDPSRLPANYTTSAAANPAPAAPASTWDDPDPALDDTSGGINSDVHHDDVTFDGVRPEDEDITFDGVRDVTFDGIRPPEVEVPVMELGPPTTGQAWDAQGLSPTEADVYEAPDYTNSAEANPPEAPPELDTETIADPGPPPPPLPEDENDTTAR